MIHKRRRLFVKWRRTQCRHHRLACNCLRNKIQRYIKDHKNQYNQFVSVSWIHYQHLDLTSGKLSKICLANVLIQMLLWSVVTLFTMTWHEANIFNEYFASISTEPDSIQSKILPRFHRCTDLFIPPLSIEPLDVYHVLLSLNPNKSKGFDNLPNRLPQIALNLLLLLSVFSSTSS